MNFVLTPSKVCYAVALGCFILTAVGVLPLGTLGLAFVAAGLLLG